MNEKSLLTFPRKAIFEKRAGNPESTDLHTSLKKNSSHLVFLEQICKESFCFPHRDSSVISYDREIRASSWRRWVSVFYLLVWERCTLTSDNHTTIGKKTKSQWTPTQLRSFFVVTQIKNPWALPFCSIIQGYKGFRNLPAKKTCPLVN